MPQDGESHSGGCLCGAIRFEANDRPLWVSHCHCRSCRRQTGSAIATFVGFTKEQFRYTSGNPVTFESSPKVWRSFCGKCGSALTYEAAWDPDNIHVYLCALDDPDGFPAQLHVFYSEKVSWFETADTLKRRMGLKE